VKTKYANVNMVSQNQRYLCGVEENRLGAVRDPEHLAAYLYNAGGARVWKFTGDVSQMGQSGKTVIEQVSLNNKTLYASSFFVASDHGYTKHYFAGSERVCSKLGGGLLLAPVMSTEATVEAIFEDYEQMRNRLFDLINKFANCNPHPEQQTVSYIDIEPYLGGIQDYLDRHEPEENRFFYHPDHLGSSNFITDAAGDGYQHLQYLPFGETAVSQKLSWWSTPYQFTGKEKDDETGYNYFGARYYNSDISIWLSVDPLASMYVSISPYAYCLNKPTNFTDPDGRWVKGAGFFRNVFYSDQRNMARLEANRHIGGEFKRDPDGGWRAFWPVEAEPSNMPAGVKKCTGIGLAVFGRNGLYSQLDGITKFFSDGIWTIGITGHAAIVAGVSFEAGAVMDFRNGFKLHGFASLGSAVGFDYSAGVILNYHKPQIEENNFSIEDLNEWSETHDLSIWYLDGSLGGNSLNEGLNPKNYSDLHTKYSSYGIGLSVGFPVGYVKTKSYTWTSKPWINK
jgi:RHS repeat-associated protein